MMKRLFATLSFSGPSRHGDWKSIDSAPRDGSVIELKNTYGLMPTYSVAKWEDEGWRDAGDPMRGVMDGPHLEWRPYAGDIATYLDPTGGRQDAPDYWDAATARSAGISVRQLHAIRARNEAEREQYGNGDNAPYWPSREWNATFTLHKGVWCNDLYPTPDDATLKRVRLASRQSAAAQGDQP